MHFGAAGVKTPLDTLSYLGYVVDYKHHFKNNLSHLLFLFQIVISQRDEELQRVKAQLFQRSSLGPSFQQAQSDMSHILHLEQVCYKYGIIWFIMRGK